MRRVLLLAICCFMCSAIFAVPVRAEERILSFRSEIVINDDASMHVIETIRVRAEGNRIKRGIYREFPTRYKDRNNNRVKVEFTPTSVLRDGNAEAWHTRSIGNGVRLYIGREDVFLDPGEYEYEIHYRTNRQLGFFEDHDELYWNVTGNGWDFPIDEASAIVYLPTDFDPDNMQLDCYTGAYGSTASNCQARAPRAGEARFRTTRPLAPGQGLTIAVGFPKGAVAPPTARQRWQWLIDDNKTGALAVAGALVIFIYYFLIWLKVGVDPRAGMIRLRDTPPTEGPRSSEPLSPAACRVIQRMGFDKKTFTVALIHMATKGYLTIDKDDDDYVVERAWAGDEVLTPEERVIAGKLFGSSNRFVFKQSRHEKIGKAIDAYRKALMLRFEKTYFLTNRRHWFQGLGLSLLAVAASFFAYDGPEIAQLIFFTVWLSGWTIGCTVLTIAAVAAWASVFSGGGVGKLGAALFITLFATPFLAAEIFVGYQYLKLMSLIGMLGIIAIFILNVVFYFLLKAPTRLGRDALDQIEGFKNYLQADQSRPFTREVSHSKELFERYLPYAIALGHEDEWTSRFTEAMEAANVPPDQYRPAFYTHPGVWTAGGLGAMAADMSSGMSTAISASSSAPGSSSGGGGGGFSGGGGGGGGGGGW